MKPCAFAQSLRERDALSVPSRSKSIAQSPGRKPGSESGIASPPFPPEAVTVPIKSVAITKAINLRIPTSYGDRVGQRAGCARKEIRAVYRSSTAMARCNQPISKPLVASTRSPSTHQRKSGESMRCDASTAITRPVMP